MQTKSRNFFDFSTRVAYIIETQTKGNREFSDKTGIPYTSVHEYATGKKKDPKLSFILKILEAYPNVNADWLLKGVGEPFENTNDNMQVQSFALKTDLIVQHQLIPLYDIEATAGLLPLFNNLSKAVPKDYIYIPNAPKCDGSIYITGDSMYPLLKSGDIVAFKIIKDFYSDIYWGEKYIVSIELDDDAFITTKFVQRSEKENHIKLVSQNKHHQDKEVPIDKIRAMALVKLNIRFETMG